jgi:succinate-semialdehyde dehydrogenase/glutarate-semialdehyde dehydrogenase
MVNLSPGGCLIGGEWVTAESQFDVRNPADGSLLARVPDFGSDATGRAINAAADALPRWAALSAHERSAALLRFHSLALAHEDELTAILSAEQGKPLAEARSEIRYAASFLQWFGEEAKRAYGEIVPAPRADQRIFVLKQPIGVVAAITPWNFPAAMVTRKLAPALAAGCTIVIKPSEQTPLTALALAALSLEAGIPAGVVNVVTGDAAAIGAELAASETVRKLTFTGSTEIGALLYAACAPTIKKLSLELGGNAPFIVFDDADPEEAAAAAISAKFRNAGQTCVCANRFFVQAGIHDRFAKAFAAQAGRLKVGRGDEAGVAIGPLIDDASAAKVDALVADALAKGARAIGPGLERNGRFVNPLILTGITAGMAILEQEIFGPVAPIVRFNEEADAVTMSNRTSSGLAAYLFTNDIRRAWRVAEALEAGMVGVNTGLISNEVLPFGGIKSSGLGREGSRHGLDDYLELKAVSMAL